MNRNKKLAMAVAFVLVTGAVILATSGGDGQWSLPNRSTLSTWQHRFEQWSVNDLADVVVPNEQGAVRLLKPLPEAAHISADSNQVFTDDLVVDEDERIDGDVVVANGEAHIKRGGQISGNLTVYNGDVRIDEGGKVNGNLASISGDVRISGEVNGNVTAFSGDVNLRDTAKIGGDVSVMAGDVNRASGATVGGNIVRGPRLDIPAIPNDPFDFAKPGVQGANDISGAAPGLLRKFGGFVLRLISMTLLALIVGAIVWLIAQVRPVFVATSRTTMSDQAALSFVVGILANVMLLIVGGLLALTICLLPITLITYAVLIAVNLLGWAAIASALSQRLIDRYQLSIQPDYVLGLTAAAIAALFGVLWAIGGCFQGFAFIAALIVSSIGVGAVLLPTLNKHMGIGEATPQTTASTELSTEVRATEQPVSGPPASRTEETDMVDNDQVEGAGAKEPSVSLQEDMAAAEPNTDPDVVAEPAVFTRMRGIGPVAAEKLVDAGVTTFRAVAEMSAEDLGRILNWSPDRVRQTKLIEQAFELADDE